MSVEFSQADRFITRAEIPAFLAPRGYVITRGYLDLLCMPAMGKGPPAAGRFGGRYLYDPNQVLAWAQARAQSFLRASKVEERVA